MVDIPAGWPPPVIRPQFALPDTDKAVLPADDLLQPPDAVRNDFQPRYRETLILKKRLTISHYPRSSPAEIMRRLYQHRDARPLIQRAGGTYTRAFICGESVTLISINDKGRNVREKKLN